MWLQYLQVEPVEAVNTRKVAPLSAQQRPRVATALAQSAATRQSLVATLEKVQVLYTHACQICIEWMMNKRASRATPPAKSSHASWAGTSRPGKWLQRCIETLMCLQAAEQRLKSLQEGNMSLRTDIGAEEIKLQAASQVLKVSLVIHKLWYKPEKRLSTWM